MKKYFIALSALFASYTISAQFTFGIDGGLSIPSSDYGSASNSSNSGFAKLGSCYDGYVGFKFIPVLGAMVQYGVNNNSFNISSFNSASNGNFTSSGGDKITEYLIGPYVSIKLIKIKIEAKLLAGLVSGSYPTLSSSSTFGGVTSSVEESFSTGNAFGYCAGAKIKYMVAGHLGIGLGLDYVGSDITYKGTSTVESGGLTTSNPANNKMNVGVLQATLGLSVDL